ncbi:MAG: DUF4982 domain-containing protein, partial [Chitinispirillaceae bacterium]|nr:DUF4982 domain-containing protein [Chitinispirillaceae bacterium]
NFEGENVLAVKTDNRYDYLEVSSGVNFQWNRGSYTTNFGGITQNVYLHVTDKCYQTLPLFSNLKTLGTYIYGKNYNIPGKSADITVESQVKNESGAAQTATLRVDIVDMDGNLLKTFNGTEQTLANGATAIVKVTNNVTNINFWNIGYGYLYDVYTMLVIGGTPTDVVKTKTGFRKMEYGNGVVKMNDRLVHIKGFAPRSQNPWPAIGDAYPAWLADFQHLMIRNVHGNTIRPMHVCALRTDIESADRTGMTYMQPAGDAEGAVTGRQWEQRKEVMRDVIIYSRNNPSVLYWEAGNADISESQMQEMLDTAHKWDPNGGRVQGCRGILGTRVAEWAGEMLYVNKSKTRPRFMTEYQRNESPRRWWDQYSPPEFHENDAGTSTVAGMNMNQDMFIRESVFRWWEAWIGRPGFATGPNTRVCAGGVKIECCDGTTFARSEENYRRSGVMDAMRLPKDAYGAFKVMWNGWVEVDNKDVYLVGHWNYPANTRKNVYVVSNCEKVELFVNNVSKGFGTQEHRFFYSFPNITWEAGTIKAVGYDKSNVKKAEDQRVTAGAANRLKLTPHVSPAGLRATGADLALIDVEVVDANGLRCPTANNTITWAVSGPAEYRGGMAGGAAGNYILKNSLPVECGLGRIMVRPTTTAGTITVSASAGGLTGASVTLTSTAVPLTGGITTVMPCDGLPSNLEPLPPYQLANPQAKTIFPTSCSAGTNSYDDYENTSSSAASITYNFASQQVSAVHIKFSDFRNSHNVRISVGSTQVYSGTLPGGLGYVPVTFNPVTGSAVTIAAASGSIGITEAEFYGPGELSGIETVSPQNASMASMVRKYQDRLVVTLPGTDFRVRLVDLAGKTVYANHGKGDRVSGTVLIKTNRMARGVYLLEIRNNAQHIRKEAVFIR